MPRIDEFHEFESEIQPQMDTDFPMYLWLDDTVGEFI